MSNERYWSDRVEDFPEEGIEKSVTSLTTLTPHGLEY